MNNTFHPTALDAVNEALVKLGEDVVLEELSKTADETVINAPVSRKAAYVYDAARRQVLTEHPWSFATSLKSVTSLLTADGEYETQVPGGALQVIACYGFDGEKVECLRTARVIHSVQALKLLAYTRDIDDLDVWPHQVRAVLVARLAADLAKIVTGRQIDLQTYEQAYQVAMENAKLWDARQQNPRRKPYGRCYIADCMRGYHPDVMRFERG